MMRSNNQEREKYDSMMNYSRNFEAKQEMEKRNFEKQIALENLNKSI